MKDKCLKMNKSYKHTKLLLNTFAVLGGLYFVYHIFYLRNFFFFNSQPLLVLPETVNCSTFGFNDISTNKIPIYDFFLFDHELDLLEIRLYELYDYVTLFLIAESDRTFSGKSKPLYLKENWSRFAKYHNKIRRVEINLADIKSNTMDTWSKEAKSRYAGIQLAVPKSSKDYILLTSDVDEIPKARFVWALASCHLPKPFPSILLQCDYYYYSYEFRNAADPYSPGVSVSQFGPNETVPLNLRKLRLNFRSMFGACFHCSYCFDRISSVREKLNSFSHTEVNLEKYHNQQHIIDRFQNGKDLFDRRNQPLRRTTQDETDVPKLLKDEPQRFMYMLNRSSSPNAAFQDVS